VEAEGTPPLSYQWQFLNDSLAGETNRLLQLRNVQTNQAGIYRVVVTNLAGSTTSFPAARLRVLTAPVITQQPENLTVTNGVARRVYRGSDQQPAAGLPVAVPGAAMPDATNATLVLSNTHPALAGLYDVAVSNAGRPGGQPAGSVDGGHTPGHAVWPGDGCLERAAAGGRDRDGGRPINHHRQHRALPVGAGQSRIVACGFRRFPADGRTPLTVRFINLTLETALTVDAGKADYHPYANSRVPVRPGETVELNFSLSPVIVSPQQMRLVLNWGAVPRDLDAHLVTPSIEGTNYHVFYALGSRGRTNAAPYAQLDVDQQNGYGPGTITITRFMPGTYHYYVHKFEEFTQGGTLTNFERGRPDLYRSGVDPHPDGSRPGRRRFLGRVHHRWQHR